MRIHDKNVFEELEFPLSRRIDLYVRRQPAACVDLSPQKHKIAAHRILFLEPENVKPRTSVQSDEVVYTVDLTTATPSLCSGPQIPKLAMLSPEEIGTMGAFYDEARPCFHWSYHSPYLQVRKHRSLPIGLLTQPSRPL